MYRLRRWSRWGSAWMRCGSRSRRSSARASRRHPATSRSRHGPKRCLSYRCVRRRSSATPTSAPSTSCSASSGGRQRGRPGAGGAGRRSEPGAPAGDPDAARPSWRGRDQGAGSGLGEQPRAPLPDLLSPGPARWTVVWPRSNAGWACGLTWTIWTRRSRRCAGRRKPRSTGGVGGLAALRDQEKQLLAARAAREKEWTGAAAGRMTLAQELGQVNAELERLQSMLREHGIEPGDDAA